MRWINNNSNNTTRNTLASDGGGGREPRYPLINNKLPGVALLFFGLSGLTVVAANE